MTKLNFGSLEFKVIANLLHRTLSIGQPRIECIQKLQNNFVQEKFMTELKLFSRKH